MYGGDHGRARQLKNTKEAGGWEAIMDRFVRNTDDRSEIARILAGLFLADYESRPARKALFREALRMGAMTRAVFLAAITALGPWQKS